MTLNNQSFRIPDNYTDLTPNEFRALVVEAESHGIDLKTIKQAAIQYVKANEDLIRPEYRDQ